MDAREIISGIGKGVRDALTTKELFLGVEAEAFANPEIHPEYVTTVKVGEALTGPSRVVSLETHMKQLRVLATSLARWKALGNKHAWSKIDVALAEFTFGKKDTKRLDLLVLDADPHAPPMLMAEAKLGVRNLGGVKADVDRVLRLLDMFEAVGERSDRTYAAVVFHLMEQDRESGGTVVRATTNSAKGLIDGVESHLIAACGTRAWLKFKVGLLKSAERVETTRGYLEVEDEESDPEMVFAKHGFRFSPGLVLLGSAPDVIKAQF